MPLGLLYSEKWVQSTWAVIGYTKICYYLAADFLQIRADGHLKILIFILIQAWTRRVEGELEVRLFMHQLFPIEGTQPLFIQFPEIHPGIWQIQYPRCSGYMILFYMKTLGIYEVTKKLFL